MSSCSADVVGFDYALVPGGRQAHRSSDLSNPERTRILASPATGRRLNHGSFLSLSLTHPAGSSSAAALLDRECG